MITVLKTANEPALCRWAPVVLTVPEDQIALVGSTLTLDVTMSGTAPFNSSGSKMGNRWLTGEPRIWLYPMHNFKTAANTACCQERARGEHQPQDNRQYRYRASGCPSAGFTKGGKDQSVMIQLKANATQPATYRWFKDGNELTQPEAFLIEVYLPDFSSATRKWFRESTEDSPILHLKEHLSDREPRWI